MKMIFDRNGEGRREPCCGAGNDFRQLGLFQVEAGTAFGRTPADLYYRGGRAFGDSRPLLG